MVRQDRAASNQQLPDKQQQKTYKACTDTFKKYSECFVMIAFRTREALSVSLSLAHTCTETHSSAMATSWKCCSKTSLKLL